MITTGARYIGELLHVNSVLRTLKMGWNNIGDSGITVIARTLGRSRIKKLNVRFCEITVTGAKELALGLSLNFSITELDVCDNPITVEGARIVLQSAVNNGVCEEINMDSNYATDSKVQKMREAKQKV